MCRWRQVCFVFQKCGCAIQQPDEEVLCDSPNCKFSPFHPKSCQLPACRKTCTQQRGYPQQHTVTVNAVCPNHGG
ncbi:hypothetical protein DFP72DRAFT_173661 [Ephemerocybe angulata]|uniref:Uncharacterized protein n=1 Tax=Ephemerocybe angulata TaxID=980116 RepID=A0A8H6I5X8_9AGAR|nr:hypothetical protein DFP72DRAFT_193539 [Tulosesus angulatus]KAF6758482.1 hypothetical protein DFP72DRAFT_173661 [Tulosesus angulatus]